MKSVTKFLNDAYIQTNAVLNSNAANAIDKFAWDANIMRNSYLDAHVENLSQLLDFPDDQIRYVSCMILAFPLALFMRFLPLGTPRHVLNFVIGILFAQFNFGSGWIHSVFTSLVSFLLIWLLPRKIMPKVVAVFMITYLSGCHIHRVTFRYLEWTLDHSTVQMLLTIKITSLAWNVYDHAEKGELESQLQKKVLPGYKSRLFSDRLYRCQPLPSIFSYLGYCFNFTGLLAGPAFEFVDYLTGTECPPVDTTTGIEPKGRITAAFMQTLKAVINILIFIFGNLWLGYEHIHIKEVMELDVLTAAWYMWLWLGFHRARYYFAWLLAEGSTILGGWGYDEKTKQWNKNSNCIPFGFEFAGNCSQVSRVWNSATQNWLEQYVYHRSNRSLMFTYAASAFWHGFYPGYYFFFLALPLITMVERMSRRKVRPYFTGKSIHIYNFIAWLCTSLTVNYQAAAFTAMAYSYSMAIYDKLYYSGHITFSVLFAILSLLPTPKIKKE